MDLNHDTAEKIYKEIKNGSSISEIKDKFNLSDTELDGLIYFLNIHGKRLIIDKDDNGTPCFFKQTIRKTNKIIKPNKEDLICTKLYLISDTHFGNNKQQLHLVNDIYRKAYENEISDILHCGDIVDGDYTDIRKEQARNIFLYGFDEQAGYVADMYPEVSGITTHYILGSHDETHYKRNKATINFFLDHTRKDMKFLGQDYGEITIDNVRYALDHPGDGSSYGLSYKPQKRIEELESGLKPGILAIGHYHKSYYFAYRNVRGILVPCLCGKTQFQQKKGLKNIVGYYELTIYSDNKGNIQYFNAKDILYNENELWDEVGKDAKKVKRLVIK